MELHGYGTDAQLADGVLSITARNVAAKGALGGASRDIPVTDIAALELKPASLLTNGRITIESSAGITILHFLKKSGDEASALFVALQELSSAHGAARPAGKLANETRDAWSAAMEQRVAEAKNRLAVARGQQHTAFAKWRNEHGAERAALRDAVFSKVVSGASDADIARITALLDAAEQDLRPEIALGGDDLMRTVGERPVTDVVSGLLDLAAEAGKVGDIELEEQCIAEALHYAKRKGDRKERRAALAEVASREADGRLRVGSQMLGVIAAEGTLTQWSRKQSLSAVNVGGERQIVVRSDRVIAGGKVRPVDEFTSAQVYLDGQQQITQRPTLTRMALLSPLPGTALAPGMALQKKTVHDLRAAEFQIGSVSWSFRATIPPATVNLARAIAEQTNRIAQFLEKKNAAPTASPGDAVEAVLTQLERLSYLVERGLVTTEESDRIRSIVLGLRTDP